MISTVQHPQGKVTRWATRVAAVLIGAIGLFSGWEWIGQPGIAPHSRDTVPMAPATAGLLVLFSIVLAAYPHGLRRRWFRHGAAAVAALAAVLAALVLVRTLSGWGPDWEQRFAPLTIGVDGVPIARMSPFTAVAFILASFALLATFPPWDGRAALRALAIASVAIAGIFCGACAMAYFAGVPFFTGWRVVPMAWSTAIAFTALNAVLLILTGGASWLDGFVRDVRGKLIAGLGAVFAIVVLLAAVAYLGLAGADRSQRAVFRDNLANVYDIARFRANVNAERLDIAVMLELTPRDWDRWRADLAQRTTENDEILARLAVRLADDPEAMARLGELTTARREFVAAREARELQPAANGRLAEAKASFFGEQLQRHLQMRDLGRWLEESEANAANAIIAANERRARVFRAMFIGGGTAAIAAAAWLSVLLHRVLTNYITERHRAEAALGAAGRYNRTLIEASVDPFVTIGIDGKLTDVNAATEQATGRGRAELIGTDFSEYFTESARARAGYEAVFREGLVRDYPLELRHRGGSTIPVLYNASIYRDEQGNVAGVFAAARDVTHVRRAEAELRRVNQALRATSACNQVLVKASDEPRLLAEVCRVIVGEGGYRMAWVGFAENDSAKTVRPVAHAGHEAGYLARSHISWANDASGHGPTGTAIRTRRVAICRDMLVDPDFAPWREAARERGYGSSIVVPLVHRETVVGALSIYAAEPDAFGAGEAKWLAELGEDIAYGVIMLRTRAERERAVEALRRLQQLLTQTQAISKIGGWEYDVATRRLVWTDEVYRLYGVTPATYDPNDVANTIDFYVAGDRERIDAAFRRAVAAGEPYDLELQVVTAQQRHLWVRTVGEAERIDGQVARVFGSIMDITERRQAESLVAAERQRLKSLLELLPVYVILLTPDYQVAFANAFFRGRFGESRGRRCYEYLFGLREPCPVCESFKVLKTQAPHRWEWKGPDQRTYSIFDLPFTDTDGSTLILEMGIDVTEQRRAEQEIRQLNAELERRVADRTMQLAAANKELEAFAYSVAHDLRGPLRTVDGFSRILLEDYAGKLDAEGCDNLQRIRAGSQQMGELIDDVLALSRTSRIAMRRVRVDLTAMAEQVVAELHARNPERKVTCRIERGLEVTGDPALLRVVLENLLNNAWKFTGRREQPEVEFGCTEADGERTFFVRDNGAGFDMAYIDKLFGPFQRLHTTEEFPGNGIGLATVQRIIHRHEGRIWARAAVDGGATFWFTLAAKPDIL